MAAPAVGAPTRRLLRSALARHRASREQDQPAQPQQTGVLGCSQPNLPKDLAKVQQEGPAMKLSLLHELSAANLSLLGSRREAETRAKKWEQKRKQKAKDKQDREKQADRNRTETQRQRDQEAREQEKKHRDWDARRRDRQRRREKLAELLAKVLAPESCSG